jgi:hypothetical protein
MTEKNTVSLAAGEFRVLVASNLQDATQFVQNNAQLNAEQVKALNDHLDRIKVFVASWHASAPLPVATPEVAAAAAAQGNGAAPVKRKGGWPAGKKRTPRAPEAVQ